MFERFTEKAIKTIMLAQEESRRLGHNHVGTEQILLGLLRADGSAQRVLEHLGLELKSARVEVESITGRGSGQVAVEIPFTSRGKKALEQSWDVARKRNQKSIEDEHLLLGILNVKDCTALQVLAKLGVSPAEIISTFKLPANSMNSHVDLTRAIERLKAHELGILQEQLREWESIESRAVLTSNDEILDKTLMHKTRLKETILKLQSM